MRRDYEPLRRATPQAQRVVVQQPAQTQDDGGFTNLLLTEMLIDSMNNNAEAAQHRHDSGGVLDHGGASASWTPAAAPPAAPECRVETPAPAQDYGSIQQAAPAPSFDMTPSVPDTSSFNSGFDAGSCMPN